MQAWTPKVTLHDAGRPPTCKRPLETICLEVRRCLGSVAQLINGRTAHGITPFLGILEQRLSRFLSEYRVTAAIVSPLHSILNLSCLTVLKLLGSGERSEDRAPSAAPLAFVLLRFLGAVSGSSALAALALESSGLYSYIGIACHMRPYQQSAQTSS